METEVQTQQNNSEQKIILESIFLLKEMGFSLYEMESFTLDETFILIDIYVDRLEKKYGSGTEKKTIEATQEDIDRLLG